MFVELLFYEDNFYSELLFVEGFNIYLTLIAIAYVSHCPKRTLTKHIEYTDSELRISNINSCCQDLIVLAVGKILY
jgi:hypothetical protein